MVNKNLLEKQKQFLLFLLKYLTILFTKPQKYDKTTLEKICIKGEKVF
jgi:hypothetical protein